MGVISLLELSGYLWDKTALIAQGEASQAIFNGSELLKGTSNFGEHVTF